MRTAYRFAYLLTKGTLARRHHQEPDSEGIDGRYMTAIALWQARHGVNRMDMSREQDARYRAFEAAEGDPGTAARLLFERHMVRSGRIGGGDR